MFLFHGKPLILLLAEGQAGDCRRAATVLPAPPEANVLIADKGHDTDPKGDDRGD